MSRPWGPMVATLAVLLLAGCDGDGAAVGAQLSQPPSASVPQAAGGSPESTPSSDEYAPSFPSNPATAHYSDSMSKGVLAAAVVALPEDSGKGRRIVWSKNRNRTWLVNRGGTVRRTYPVTDLDWKTPVGEYEVMSKNPSGLSVDGGVNWRLPYFVKFHQRCAECGWIGFHAIPVNDQGELLQVVEDLGSDKEKSHGCIRQKETDAKALWDFAKVGTRVVVVK